jgi:hypothetical protein
MRVVPVQFGSSVITGDGEGRGTDPQHKQLLAHLIYFIENKYLGIHQSHSEVLSDLSSAVLKKKEEKNNSIVTNNQKQQSSSTHVTKAYELFLKRNTPLQVAIELNIKQSEVTKYYREYWKLRGLDKLNIIHKETNGKIWPVWKLYQRLVKEKGMTIDQIVNAIDIAIHKLPYMESLYKQLKDEVDKMQLTRQCLVNDIAAREYKISILDKTAFSLEQDCKRKELAIQQLTIQKDRIEKWITNVLKGEGYSKLKQIVKENVKAVLSDNKVLISTALAALMQTLKDNPEMANLIYNISATNNGERHEDKDKITLSNNLNPIRIGYYI